MKRLYTAMKADIWAISETKLTAKEAHNLEVEWRLQGLGRAISTTCNAEHRQKGVTLLLSPRIAAYIQSSTTFPSPQRSAAGTYTGTGIHIRLNFRGQSADIIAVYIPPSAQQHQATRTGLCKWITDIIRAQPQATNGTVLMGDFNRILEESAPHTLSLQGILADKERFQETWWTCHGTTDATTFTRATTTGRSSRKLDYIFVGGWMADGIRQCSKSTHTTLINEDHAMLWAEIQGYISPNCNPSEVRRPNPKLAVKQAPAAKRKEYNSAVAALFAESSADILAKLEEKL
ncbi:hypothetical protein H4R20_003700, partial [Coemansia guatemalensis]